ncbi:hypothetical protein K503DRAFT_839490, partial [Rhizopogon vinicolor AM-OR11-026]
MIAFSILIVLSLRPIRIEAYEVFFYTHFFAVGILLVGGYYHRSAVHGSFWIWPSFISWALNRSIRVVRLLVFNHSYFSFKSGCGTMDTTTELLSEKCRAYADYHISTDPQAKQRTQSCPRFRSYYLKRPFTIASFDSSLLSTAMPEDQSRSYQIQSLGSDASFWKELVFLINMHKRFTKKLNEMAARKGQVKVFENGPCGSSPDLGCYDMSVLAAGGSGISYTLPVFLNVIKYHVIFLSGCAVVFIWAIRGAAYVQLIEEAFIKAQLAPPSLTISIRIFITGPLSTAEPEDSLSSSRSLLSLHGVKMETGRPNMEALLKEDISSASGRMLLSDNLWSQGLSRAVRRALCHTCFPMSGPSTILNGGPSVT